MPIKYLNTDLDVAAPVDITELVREFETKGLVSLHPELRKGKEWLAIFETEAEHSQPDSNISDMLTVIESSSDRIKVIWNACTQREFNIGYECGDEPWAFNQGLTSSTLQRMANAGATLRITIYPAVPSEQPATGDA